MTWTIPGWASSPMATPRRRHRVSRPRRRTPANFNLSATAGGQGTLVSGNQGTASQKSAIRALQVVFSSFVFLDPGLQSGAGTRGLILLQQSSPLGPSGSDTGATPVAVGVVVASASYNRSTGTYTITYTFTGPTTEYGSLQDSNYTVQFHAAAIQGGGPGGPGLLAAGNPYAAGGGAILPLLRGQQRCWAGGCRGPGGVPTGDAQPVGDGELPGLLRLPRHRHGGFARLQ